MGPDSAPHAGRPGVPAAQVRAPIADARLRPSTHATPTPADTPSPIAGTAVRSAERHALDAAAAIFEAGLDLRASLDAVARAAQRALGADRATCYLIDDGGRVASVHTTEADPARRAALDGTVGLGAGDLPVWRLLVGGADPILMVGDLARAPGIPRGTADVLGASALIGARLEVRGGAHGEGYGLLGALFCSFAAPRRLGARQRRIVAALAAVAAPALAAARLADRREAHEAQQLAEQEALRRLATAVAGQRDPEGVAAQAARLAAGLMDAHLALVARFDDGVAHSVGAWQADPEAPFIPSRPLQGGGALARIAATGRPVRVPDYGALPPADPARLAALAEGCRSSVAVPVRVAGRLWGALLTSSPLPRAFPPEAEARLERFAELVGLAVDNAETRTVLARQALTDALTGLANHRAFHVRLAEEVQRARRHHRPLSLVLFDIDHFKQVNDVHGHQRGDDVLRTVARLLRAEARAGDTVARTGGEEFAWLLPESAAEAAMGAAERARAAVAAAGLGGLRVTLSAGVCELAQAGGAAELVSLADAALYWAKAHGRDMACLYAPEVVEALTSADRAAHIARTEALRGLRALAQTVDRRLLGGEGHSERVADLAARLAVALGWSLGRSALLREAALVHDVGLVGIPEGPRASDPTDAAVRAHPVLGAGMTADVLRPEQVAWIRSHHERWDGGGYPDGLRGERIPAGARIIAVAEAWDAMTCGRPWAAPRDPVDALGECRAQRGGQFDAEVVDALPAALAAGEGADVRGGAPRA